MPKYLLHNFLELVKTAVVEKDLPVAEPTFYSLFKAINNVHLLGGGDKYKSNVQVLEHV